MILRYSELHQHLTIFQSMTGLRVNEFDGLFVAMEGYYVEAETARLDRPDRKRAMGAGGDQH